MRCLERKLISEAQLYIKQTLFSLSNILKKGDIDILLSLSISYVVSASVVTSSVKDRGGLSKCYVMSKSLEMFACKNGLLMLLYLLI
jgi:hypothetical protein